MAKEIIDKKYPVPVVTESRRKKHPGFVNPNKGIEVAPGLTMQDVPREMIMQHMRQTEDFWKQKFNMKHGSSHGAAQSF
ncbi:MAG TPA: hypothetical protein VNU45_18015 [Rummeliibacillus sp.]|nr:hypothetical protein [Rummeliibacillus sp.]